MQTAAIAVLTMIATPMQAGIIPPGFGKIQRVQVSAPLDSAHTLVQPNAPDPGRIGQTVPLPQGGVGVTTGGTSNYQTFVAPGGGTGIAVPHGNNTSTVIVPGGRTGTINTPR